MTCDQCGEAVRATVTVSKPTDDKLLKLRLCGHHARIHHEKLLAEGWSIEPDEGVEFFTRYTGALATV